VSTISGGHKRSVRCVEWKDYGPRSKTTQNPKRQKVTLATGSFDANVGIWEHNPSHGKGQDNDLEDQEMNETDLTRDRDEDEEWNFTTLLTGPDSEIKSIAFSPPHYGANLLATSSRDKSVWVWEEVEDEEWETIAVCQEHTGDVKCVAWCEGGRFPKRRKLTPTIATNAVEDEEEDRVVASREVLASGSYDDTIRLWRDVEEEGDWACVAVIEGHDGTVWDVCWEKYINTALYRSPHTEDQIDMDWEPRLLSCSDDMTIRVWRRELNEVEKEKKRSQQLNGIEERAAPRLPSIIRPPSNFEKWSEEKRLPTVHVRSIYAIDWSRDTGLVVSCGGDGTIAVYKEILCSSSDASTSQDVGETTTAPEDVIMNGTPESHNHTLTQTSSTPQSDPIQRQTSKWVVVALLESAHEEYEVNHVCFAKRRDRDTRFEGEEIVVTTADDGNVKLWTLPEECFEPLA
jgi:cytosolic iron-sulfur protein assembly protein CIAO1